MKRQIVFEGEVALVPLTKGYTAVIDAADVPLIENRSWCADVRANRLGEVRTVYALAGIRSSPGVRSTMMLHRAIFDPGPGFIVDHIDGDGLNNRRSNLRAATPSNNLHNAKVQHNSKTGVKGVFYAPNLGKWYAQIRASGKVYTAPVRLSLEQAAQDYEELARVHAGNFARSSRRNLKAEAT